MSTINGERLLIRAHRECWADSVSLRIGIERQNEHDIAQPIVFSRQKSGLAIEPCLTLKTAEAQQLMDELWLCGLRPTEGTGSAGAYAAQGKHLEDMRQLVFKEKYKEK